MIRCLALESGIHQEAGSRLSSISKRESRFEEGITLTVNVRQGREHLSGETTAIIMMKRSEKRLIARQDIDLHWHTCHVCVLNFARSSPGLVQ